MSRRDRPRVTHLVPAQFSEDGVIGGAERYVLELARHMSMATPTSLLTFGPTGGQHTDGDLTVTVLPNPTYIRGQQQNPFSLKMFRCLKSADVIHCHQQHIVATSLAAIYARARRKKVFVTDLGGGGWDLSAFWSTDRWFHGHLHISQYSRNIFGHEGYAAARVIYGGVDAERFAPPQGPTRRTDVVFVGRLLPHKGINYLVDAMPPDIPLKVIGRVSDQDFVRDLQRAAEGKDISFQFDADDLQIIQAYQRALCLVLPSVYQSVYGDETKVPELLGQTLLEGMACGAPVICTDVASMPEIVRHGETGFVVPPNDPEALSERIRWLHAHPEEAAHLGQRGRRVVKEHFSWTTVVQRCLEAYRELGFQTAQVGGP